MKLIVCIVVWMIGSSLFGASRPLQVSFKFDNGSQVADIDIEQLQFYVSGVKLYDGGKTVFAEQDSYHLIVREDSARSGFTLDIPSGIEFTHIQFNLGVDSTMNVSGAFGGDLDPMHGMYWVWQSGYINFKLEGTSVLCPARHHRFQFHIGGYQYPNASIQQVRLKVLEVNGVTISFNASLLFEQINIEEEYAIMSPGHKAVVFSSLLPELFAVVE